MYVNIKGYIYTYIYINIFIYVHTYLYIYTSGCACLLSRYQPIGEYIHIYIRLDIDLNTI
jgi:hypothetical protein